MRVVTVLLCCLAMLSCSKPAEKHMTLQERIEEALSSLLTRRNEDAFVIFEDRATKKFVQFAGNANQPLFLDIPSQALKNDEIDRAKRLFGQYGVKLKEWEVYDRPGGSVAGRQSGFQMELGKDTGKAAEVAWRVFTEVYRLQPDFDLSIEEN